MQCYLLKPGSLSHPRICDDLNFLSQLAHTGLDLPPICWVNRDRGMKGTKTKLTIAPEGFELYRVCDRQGVCHEVKGMWAAEHLVEDNAAMTAKRTQYSDDWV